MLRQCIGQIQEFLELYRSLPPHSFSSQIQSHGWYFLELDNSSVDDDCCNLIIRHDKSSSLKMVEAINFQPTKKSRKEKIGEKMPAIVYPTDIMEQQIWKDFPEDLFEAVIARLPIAAFFRFRPVCRKWNNLLTSETFSQCCAEVPQTHPWFYMITHENVNSGAMYDPLLKKWHHQIIPSLPRKMINLQVASAGGLICFLDIGHRHFYICNPLTRSFRELPARSAQLWSHVAVGMTLSGSSTSSGYKILWVGCNGDHEVYDSVGNSWTRPGNMPPSIKLPLSLNFRSQAVSINGILYFMCAEPDGILSYDMASGVWKQYVIPPPPHLTDYTLAESRGQIMLVGLLTKNAATCVCIWELQRMTLLWKEVDRMPNVWCLEFYGKHVRMTCLGNRGLLMLSLRSRQMSRLVTYDASSREWSKVSGCVLPRGRKRQRIECGTAFHPCLTALA
ncbi:hypothetical protein AAC387_Pa02g1779 [Persea americana]